MVHQRLVSFKNAIRKVLFEVITYSDHIFAHDPSFYSRALSQMYLQKLKSRLAETPCSSFYGPQGIEELSLVFHRINSDTNTSTVRPHPCKVTRACNM